MSTTDTDTEDDPTRAFARALFGRTDEPDKPADDKETVTPEPEPEPDDDLKAARLIFTPTEGES